MPLFLDEALTTSDEARFAVMAQSLERLVGEEEAGDGSGIGGSAGNGLEDGTGSGPRRQVRGRRRPQGDPWRSRVVASEPEVAGDPRCSPR